MFDMEFPQAVSFSPTPQGKKATHRVTTEAARQVPAGSQWVPRMSREAAVSLLQGMSSRKESLFAMNSQAGAQDVPQRVMPTADLPELSGASQEEVFSQLVEVLQNGAPNSSIAVGAPTAGSTPAAAGGAQVRGTWCCWGVAAG